MKFLTKTFSARKSTQVKVTFSKSTSVKLMSKRNLDKYRKSQTHTYWGGKFDNSPVVFDVPGDGQWCVVVEKGTQRNPMEVEASIELVSGGLEATALPGGGAVPKPRAKKIKAPVAEEEVAAANEAEESSDNEENSNDEMTATVGESSDDDESDSKSE